MAYLLPWPVLVPNDDETTRVLRRWLHSAGIARTQIARSKGNRSLREIQPRRYSHTGRYRLNCVLAISFGGITHAGHGKSRHRAGCAIRHHEAKDVGQMQEGP